jgi:hypothetical protein
MANKGRQKLDPACPRDGAKSTRQEVSGEPRDTMREPLRMSNKPDGRRRVARRGDDEETPIELSDDEQEIREELSPMTADEDEDENETPKRLSDNEEGSDDEYGPGTSAKRARGPDGRPRRVKSEIPRVSLPATKVFERDADGSLVLNCRILLIFVGFLSYFMTVETPS